MNKLTLQPFYVIIKLTNKLKGVRFMIELKIEKTAESVVSAIRTIELDVGESFLEYNDIFPDASNIMEFAREKDAITEEKYQTWKQGFEENEQGAEETFEVMFGEDEEWEPFCISYEDPESELDYDDQYSNALLIYGELIVSKDEYFEEFKKTIAENFAKVVELS